MLNNQVLAAGKRQILEIKQAIFRDNETTKVRQYFEIASDNNCQYKMKPYK